MAQHDITDIATEITAAGGSLDQLLAIRDIEQLRDGTVIAWNRKAEAAAADLAGRITRTPAPAATTAEPLATDKQVDYASSLIAKRIRSGAEGGFVSFQGGGYPSVEQLKAMTRRDISRLIDDLRAAW